METKTFQMEIDPPLIEKLKLPPELVAHYHSMVFDSMEEMGVLFQNVLDLYNTTGTPLQGHLNRKI